MAYSKKYFIFALRFSRKMCMFVRPIRGKAMEKKMKDLTDALQALFSGDDYSRRAAATRAAIESMGEYQGLLKDKENMRNDKRNIYSDMNIAIKEGYGKIAAQ